MSPDRLRMSQDASLDTAQPSDGPVSNRSPATDRIYVPVRPSPDQAHSALPNAHPAPPMPPSEADPLSEQHSIAQDAQLAEVNAARRLKDLPPITNPDALVESFLEDVSYFSSYATHIVKPTDPRISEFKDAIKAEDDGLEQRQVFKREIIPLHKRKSLNILRSRYVHAIKNVGTPDQKHKSRLVVQAVKRADRDSPNLFKYSSTTTRSSTRILLSTAASSEWELRTRDISQAFVSSEFDLLR